MFLTPISILHTNTQHTGQTCKNNKVFGNCKFHDKTQLRIDKIKRQINPLTERFSNEKSRNLFNPYRYSVVFRGISIHDLSIIQLFL